MVFLLMDKALSSKHIEAIYELEYNEVTKQWLPQLLYHQLAAELSWQGCRSGKPASSETIASLIEKDPIKQSQIVLEC